MVLNSRIPRRQRLPVPAADSLPRAKTLYRQIAGFVQRDRVQRHIALLYDVAAVLHSPRVLIRGRDNRVFPENANPELAGGWLVIRVAETAVDADPVDHVAQ